MEDRFGRGVFCLFIVVYAGMQGSYGQDEDDWNWEASLGDNVTFKCETTNQPRLKGSYVDRWMFPDLSNVNTTYNDGRRFALDEGERFAITNIQREDVGQYHCMTKYFDNDTMSEEWYLIRIGLNVKGPYFEDLWNKYKQNVFNALLAMFSFLAAAAYVWIVSVFRWQPDKETERLLGPLKVYEDLRVSAGPGTYVNKAFDANSDHTSFNSSSINKTRANKDTKGAAVDGNLQTLEF